MAKIVVVLSGCGNMDGSEIHESVSALIAIDQKGWDVVFAAPDVQQQTTVSYISRQKMPPRNALQESARIARGQIKKLSGKLLEDVDAVVVPGGLGAALTLCDFALSGSSCTALPEVAEFLRSAWERKIPIGAMCIAPVLIARCIPGTTLTIGNDQNTADKIRKLGCIHVNCKTTAACIDKKNRIVTTPAYMTANGPAEVLEGAICMINALGELINPSETDPLQTT